MEFILKFRFQMGKQYPHLKSKFQMGYCFPINFYTVPHSDRIYLQRALDYNPDFHISTVEYGEDSACFGNYMICFDRSPYLLKLKVTNSGYVTNLVQPVCGKERQASAKKLYF